MNRLVICLVVATLVSGCGGQPSSTSAASAPSPVERSSAGSTHAAENPPVLPRIARRNSLSGARAFTRYFIELQNFALGSGQTGELRRVIAPSCLMCLALPNLIDATYGGGGRIDGGRWSPTSELFVQANDPSEVPTGMGFFGVNVHVEPTTVYSPKDVVVGSFDGSQHDRYLSISTRWIDDHWQVDGISGVSGQQP